MKEIFDSSSSGEAHTYHPDFKIGYSESFKSSHFGFFKQPSPSLENNMKFLSSLCLLTAAIPIYLLIRISFPQIWQENNNNNSSFNLRP